MAVTVAMCRLELNLLDLLFLLFQCSPGIKLLKGKGEWILAWGCYCCFSGCVVVVVDLVEHVVHVSYTRKRIDVDEVNDVVVVHVVDES